MKLTDQPLPTLVLSLVGQVKGEKCGGLVRSLGYVAMMDGCRTSTRVARERGQRKRERVMRAFEEGLPAQLMFPGYFRPAKTEADKIPPPCP